MTFNEDTRVKIPAILGCHLLHDLTLNLKQIKECFNNNQLNELIKEGQQILRQRVEKYYNL